MVGGQSLRLLAGKRVGHGLLSFVAMNKVRLDVDVVLLGLANMSAPRSVLLVVVLANNQDDSTA